MERYARSMSSDILFSREATPVSKQLRSPRGESTERYHRAMSSSGILGDGIPETPRTARTPLQQARTPLQQARTPGFGTPFSGSGTPERERRRGRGQFADYSAKPAPYAQVSEKDQRIGQLSARLAGPATPVPTKNRTFSSDSFQESIRGTPQITPRRVRGEGCLIAEKGTTAEGLWRDLPHYASTGRLVATTFGDPQSVGATPACREKRGVPSASAGQRPRLDSWARSWSRGWARERTASRTFTSDSPRLFPDAHPEPPAVMCVQSVHPGGVGEGGSTPSNRPRIDSAHNPRHAAAAAAAVARGAVHATPEARLDAMNERFQGVGATPHPITKVPGRRLRGGVRWPHEQRTERAAGRAADRGSPELLAAVPVPEESSTKPRRDPREDVRTARQELQAAVKSRITKTLKPTASLATISTAATMMTPSGSERSLTPGGYIGSEYSYAPSTRSGIATPTASPGPSMGSLTPGHTPPLSKSMSERRLPRPGARKFWR